MTFPIQVCKRLTPSSSVARQCSRTVSNPKVIIDERDCDLNDCTDNVSAENGRKMSKTGV